MADLQKNSHLLRNLVVFNQACRSLSFTRAAEVLGVSRVAVSRTIAELEAALDRQLFVRQHRSVALTEAGEVLKRDIVPALEQIADALARQRSSARVERVSITVTSAFATYWLMPRLPDFGARHPDVEVNLVVSDRYLDLDAERIDVAIRYGPLPGPPSAWRRILHEQIFPVYAPGYKARTAMQTPSDIAQERLLHLSGVYRPEARWRHWFAVHGVTAPEDRKGIGMNTYITMLQAAISGQGVALAGHPLVDSYLAEGTLLRPPGIAPLPRLYYYLYGNARSAGVEAFCDWVVDRVDARGGPSDRTADCIGIASVSRAASSA